MRLLEGIEKSFDGRSVLRGVTLDLVPHGVTCLLGASGCGKSTILRIAAGLERADAGHVLTDPALSAIVFQDPRLLPWLTVEENLRLALPAFCPDAPARIKSVLDMVQLSLRLLRSMPRELSGGMAQRVGVARALLRTPDILLMDEPFAALDAITRSKLQDMLLSVTGDRSCLFVTHDIHEAFRLARCICVMDRGVITDAFPSEDFSEPDRRAAVRRLILRHLNLKELDP